MSPELMYVLAGVLILLGLAGTVLPALPGVPLVFVGMLVGAWAGDFQRVGAWTIGILAALTVIAMAADLLASALGTKVSGASPLAFVGAAIGAVVGIFFGLPGLILGPFIGAIAGELIASQNLERATKAGFGAALGLLFGTLAKLALCFTMLGVFIAALVF